MQQKRNVSTITKPTFKRQNSSRPTPYSWIVLELFLLRRDGVLTNEAAARLAGRPLPRDLSKSELLAFIENYGSDIYRYMLSEGTCTKIRVQRVSGDVLVDFELNTSESVTRKQLAECTRYEALMNPRCPRCARCYSVRQDPPSAAAFKPNMAQAIRHVCVHCNTSR